MRQFNVNVNGNSYFVEIEEVASGSSAPAPASVASAPVSAPTVKTAAIGGNVVASPMPGLILKLVVNNGATVKKGDKIVILEAMKMENDIFASADGVVTFLVKQGDTVETGTKLASIK